MTAPIALVLALAACPALAEPGKDDALGEGEAVLVSAFRKLQSATIPEAAGLARRRERIRRRVRLPTLDLASTSNRIDLSNLWSTMCGNDTVLTPDEIKLAEPIFGRSIDYSKVRVTYCRHAEDDEKVLASAMQNFIMVPIDRPMSNATLVHELVHVWQFQRGTEAPSDSWIHRTFTDDAYAYVLEDDSSLADFAAEQQARIIEDIFTGNIPAKHPAVARIRAEVLSSRPAADPFTATQESAAGLPSRWLAVPPSPTQDAFFGSGVPLFEYQF